MTLETLLGGVILIAFVLYVLTGGADYGAGIWSALTGGQTRRRQRALIDDAIAPIWEANHVWLILIVTLLFTAFPRAYALMTTALHIPLTALLIGIVLRGSAFAFRTNEVDPMAETDSVHAVWARLFAWSSFLAPFMLGTIVGAMASGRLIGRPPSFYDTYVSPWLAPFPLSVGCFTVTLFAYLAALYLILETQERRIQSDFRTRAVWSGALVGVIGLVVVVLSKTGAPRIYEGLTATLSGYLMLVLTGLTSCAGLLALRRHWYRTARATAAVQVTLIVIGWAILQYPYLIVPDVSLTDAAPDITLKVLLWSLLVGGILLFPSLAYLYRIFKQHSLPLLPDSAELSQLAIDTTSKSRPSH